MKLSEVAQLLGCSERTIRRKVKSGHLVPYNGESRNKARFRKQDALLLASEVQANVLKHRPERIETTPNPTKPTIEVVTNKDLVTKAIKSNPIKSLLNDTGGDVLLRTTKYLKKNGLLKTTSKDAIMRYALAVQMKEKYQITAEMVEDKYFHDLVKQYQSEISHYEKELGLTPASKAKIKTEEEEEKKEVDPMENFIK